MATRRLARSLTIRGWKAVRRATCWCKSAIDRSKYRAKMEHAIRKTQYSGLTRKLAIGAAIALTLAVLLGWARAWVGSAQTDGLERMVRLSDFRSALTGALIISAGNS